jgi:DNA-binding response OmpR family regulator
VIGHGEIASRSPKMAMIVIAEDEFLIADMLAMYLEDAGHEPIVHPNGEAAFEYIRDKSVDLLITDFMMPRMTGLELATAVRSDPAKCDLPIILVSGAQTSIGRAHPALFDVVLDKPYSLEKLLKIAEDLIREGRPTSA